MRLTLLILHGVQRHRCAPDAECPYLVITRPHAGHLGVFIPPTMKQPTSMWIFPHQQAEKSLQNQHVLSILQVGSHQLQYRFFRTKKRKSHHKTNTFCPITHNPAQQAPRTPAAPINTTTGTARTRPGIQKTDIRDRMSACGGARGIRTPDLLIANETRYQLRHSPKDSNSLAPWRSATQADHDHVRDTTDRKKRSDSPVYATPLPNTTPRRYPTLRNAHEAR